MPSTLRPALVVLGALTLLCGVLYPAAVTRIGRAAFARQADGSLPVLPNFSLAATSGLIDKGTNVGLPYHGRAPDLGAFES